jgi:hypothetical protein
MGFSAPTVHRPSARRHPSRSPDFVSLRLGGRELLVGSPGPGSVDRGGAPVHEQGDQQGLCHLFGRRSIDGGCLGVGSDAPCGCQEPHPSALIWGFLLSGRDRESGPWPEGTKMSSGTLNWAFLQGGCDRDNGPWPSRSYISLSSGPSRSSSCSGPTTSIWPSKSSCSGTRWRSSFAKWTVRPYGQRIGRSFPASAG